jgi:DNA-3-methyladenine glycosylase
MPLLPLSFYQRTDVLQIARELLGKYLYTEIDGVITAGQIVETEAYRHHGDHSLTLHLQRKRHQSKGLYLPGGHAYIYTVYNRYALCNLTTHDNEHPDAVLIRAVAPTVGVETMLQRRGLPAATRTLTAGPGVMSQALGITPALSGQPLTGSELWLEDHGEIVPASQIQASARVGLAYAGDKAAGLPWRFRICNNPWTSPAR